MLSGYNFEKPIATVAGEQKSSFQALVFRLLFHFISDCMMFELSETSSKLRYSETLTN